MTIFEHKLTGKKYTIDILLYGRHLTMEDRGVYCRPYLWEGKTIFIPKNDIKEADLENVKKHILQNFTPIAEA